MKKLDYTAVILLLIAAFNWGLVGIFNFNLISTVFESPIVSRIVFVTFGLSGVYLVVYYRGLKERWTK